MKELRDLRISHIEYKRFHALDQVRSAGRASKAGALTDPYGIVLTDDLSTLTTDFSRRRQIFPLSLAPHQVRSAGRASQGALSFGLSSPITCPSLLEVHSEGVRSPSSEKFLRRNDGREQTTR